MGQSCSGKGHTLLEASSCVVCKAKDNWGFQPSKELVYHNWLGSRGLAVMDSVVFIVVEIFLHLG